jgi:hypothetical protein
MAASRTCLLFAIYNRICGKKESGAIKQRAARFDHETAEHIRFVYSRAAAAA